VTPQEWLQVRRRIAHPVASEPLRNRRSGNRWWVDLVWSISNGTTLALDGVWNNLAAGCFHPTGQFERPSVLGGIKIHVRKPRPLLD